MGLGQLYPPICKGVIRDKRHKLLVPRFADYSRRVYWLYPFSLGIYWRRIVQLVLQMPGCYPFQQRTWTIFLPSTIPPDDCWVNSSLLLQVLKLTKLGDPFIHFAKAIYIPFANLKRIGFFFGFSYGIRYTGYICKRGKANTRNTPSHVHSSADGTEDYSVPGRVLPSVWVCVDPSKAYGLIKNDDLGWY